MMEPKNVYVVMGTTGEYSDRQEWAVMAYLNEASAQEHVVKAGLRAQELYATHESRWNIPDGANEFDPKMQTDYTGTSYFIYTVQLSEN